MAVREIKTDRVDHVGFTVGDLERSVTFYRRFGFEPTGEFHAEGPDVDAGTGIADAAMDIVWLQRAGTPTSLELIRYLNHPARRSPPNSRVGAAHLCFGVSDIELCCRELREEGVEFLSEPHQDKLGVRWVYCRDPDGNTVELLQKPRT